MPWQDIIFSIGQWIFIFALFPSIFGSDKPALISSILTCTILMVYVLVYVSLSLWITAVSVGLLALTWFVLAVQKYFKK